MSEIKPVYQYKTAWMLINYWQDVDEEIFVKINKDQFYTTRIIYPAVAYEALQKENAELKEAIKKQSNAVNAFHTARSSEDKNRDAEIIRLRSFDADNKSLKECNAILTDENAAQAKRIAELEAGVVDIRDWTARWTRPDHPIVKVADRLLSASKNGE